eukprot:7390542-Prymnesium_polylepis.2
MEMHAARMLHAAWSRASSSSTSFKLNEAQPSAHPPIRTVRTSTDVGSGPHIATCGSSVPDVPRAGRRRVDRRAPRRRDG